MRYAHLASSPLKLYQRVHERAPQTGTDCSASGGSLEDPFVEADAGLDNLTLKTLMTYEHALS